VTNPRFAPEVSLRLGGAPAPAELRASLTAVQLEASLGAADRVELVLANESLRWLDHPLFKLDTELVLALGYAPDPLEQLFVGDVVGHAATFPSSGIPALTVSAQDRRVRMQEGTRERWFSVPIPKYRNTPLPDLAVATLVAGENLLVPSFDPVGAALSVILGGVEALASMSADGAIQYTIRKQDSESDFDFLTKVCAENGWELIIDHEDPLGGQKLRFFSSLGHLTPDLTLAWGRSLLDFTPRISKVGQITAVTAYIWIAKIKQQFEVTVGWDWDRAQLTLDVAPSSSPSRKPGSAVTIKRPLTPASAPRTLVSQLIPKLNGRLTGSGSTVGDPRIRPGSVLRLEGLGVEFSGLYRVTAATHTIGSDGYRTRFEVRKEIWFGSIPLPDQGAVPIQLTGALR
jgi:phage protein D